MNTEVYDGEITVDVSMWTFNSDGTYTLNQAYVHNGTYSIGGDVLKL